LNQAGQKEEKELQAWFPDFFEEEGNKKPFCLFRITENKPTRIPPLTDIESDVRQEVIVQKAFLRAKDEAFDFIKEVQERAQKLHEDKKEGIEKEWIGKGEEFIRMGNIREPMEQQKIRQKHKNMARQEFQKIWMPSCGEIFDKLAEERGFQIRTVATVKKNGKCYAKIPFCGTVNPDDLDVASRINMSYLKEGELGRGYPSLDKTKFFVARVEKIRPPTLDQVTKADLEILKRAKFMGFRRNEGGKWNRKDIQNQYRLFMHYSKGEN